MTDALGRTTAFGYDQAGRLTTTTHPDGSVSRTEYDALGNRTAMVDALGRRRTYEYDAADDQTSARDPNGATTTWTCDPSHRRSPGGSPSCALMACLGSVS